MSAYEETLRGVQWVLDNGTSYQVAKDLGITNRTINRYQNGESPIGNMKADTLGMLYNYYLKERKEMNIESLEQAIQVFNDWGKGARIYIDLSDGDFETSVYANDVQATQTFSTDNYMAVYGKDEIQGNLHIGEKRKAYIIKYARLLLDGVHPMQAEHDLVNEYV